MDDRRIEVHLTWALIGVLTAVVLTMDYHSRTKIAGMVQTFVAIPVIGRRHAAHWCIYRW